MQSSRSGQAKQVLSEVQSRHDDIKKIEKTILELHQLFVDMQMMVEQQAETLTQIEVHAEHTMVDLEQGVRDVDRAIVSAKSTRTVSKIKLPSSHTLSNIFFLLLEKMVVFHYFHHHFNYRCHLDLVVCF